MIAPQTAETESECFILVTKAVFVLVMRTFALALAVRAPLPTYVPDLSPPLRGGTQME
jgi:hypothetical protein